MLQEGFGDYDITLYETIVSHRWQVVHYVTGDIQGGNVTFSYLHSLQNTTKTNFPKCELVPRVDNAFFQHTCLLMDTLVWN